MSGKTISCQTNWSNWPVQVEKQQIIPTPPTEQEWEFVKACRNSNYGGEKHCEAMMYGPVLKAILKYINREAEYETMLNLVILNMRRKMAAKGESTDKIFDALNSRHFEQQRRELADKNRINDLERRISEDPKRKLNTIKLLEIGENVLEELKRHFEDFPFDE